MKKIDNSNYENFHGGGDFSHAYVINVEIFWSKTKNVENEYVSLYSQLDMFSWMKISYTCCQHLGPQIFNLVNTKNQPNGQKKESLSM